ncbi:MAG: phosphoglycerate dehydrogenase [Tyzzerella sp.]|uniref:D-3-phosphoglycerate dehydrogenase n=1 Tax=Candidatus Fimicola merdigallinarum TaxID=2840819 RepID=A0A9D9DZ77_9FIRM|nr:phosphoglycerate dehydrogenase [Candidatus Fimicola merdigallinarum]
MYNIRTLNNIAEKGLNRFSKHEFQVSDTIENPDGILLRSFDMHQMEIPESVKAIARAGAGTNNIPIDECSKRGIVVFNTPGANANAVKELVIAGLLMSSRNLPKGIAWTKALKDEEGNIDKLTEAGKKQFVGPEIQGKTLGVIGLGAIGVLVANVAQKLGMNVIGYDPYLSIDAAWSLSSHVNKASSLDELVSQSDYMTIHVPLNDATRNTFNKELFSKVKKGATLLNYARGELVETEAVIEALENGTLSYYVTDFPMRELIERDNVITTPHLGASTPESEENCAVMASAELIDFLKYGIIRNSVNFPNCEIPYNGKTRISITNKNVPNMIGSISSVFAKENINIDNMVNASKGMWAYNLIDTDNLGDKAEELMNELKNIDGVVSARIVFQNK